MVQLEVFFHASYESKNLTFDAFFVTNWFQTCK